jgi:hypothetical protein
MTTKPTQTFGDLVSRINDSCCSDAEVAVVVAQLLNSGRIRLNGQAVGKRVIVRPSLGAFLHWVRS